MWRILEKDGSDPRIVNRVSDSSFYVALKWTDPRMIFTCSMSDFFVQDADPWRAEAWDVIRKTPHHRWQILTKRIERVPGCLPPDWGSGFSNVWLGTSVESQDYIDRIEMLSNIPARTRFVSFEPLLGPIDLTPLVEAGIMGKIHWAIIGGESGYDSGKYSFRPCEISWMEVLVNQLQGLGIKVFVKQLGTYQVRKLRLQDWKGEDIKEWPSDLNGLKIRQFPKW